MKFKLFGLITLAITIALIGCSNSADLEDTTWILESYGPQSNLKAVSAGSEITVTFNNAEGQVTGPGGCNSYGGKYELSGSKLYITEPLIHTEISCGEEKDQQEQQFFMALQSAESYQIVGKKLTITCGESILLFKQK